jgi:hypothetical protein
MSRLNTHHGRSSEVNALGSDSVAPPAEFERDPTDFGVSIDRSIQPSPNPNVSTEPLYISFMIVVSMTFLLFKLPSI